jgi:hypothetical protein
VATPGDTGTTTSQTTNGPSDNAYQYQGSGGAANYPPSPGAKRGSSGLLIGSLICSAVALLFIPIILGPVGAVLGFVDYGRGDRKGLWAGIFGIVATVVGMVLGYAVFKATHN